MNIITSALKRRLLPVSAVFLAACTVGFSQTTSEVTASDKAKDAEVLKLNPFVVSKNKDSGYRSQQSMVGARTAKDLMDTASSVSIINKIQIDDLNAVEVHEVLKFGVAGVTQNQTINDDVNIRGFRTQTSMRDGVTKASFKRNPMFDVERVEVFKGPGAMLMGNNSFLGGGVNLVTVKPTAKREADLQLTFSSNNYVRLAQNVSGPLYKDSDLEVNYRATLGYLNANKDKEIENEDQKFIGAGLAMYMGNRITLDIAGYYFVDNGYYYWEDFMDYNTSLGTNAKPVLAKLNQYSGRKFSPARRKNAFWRNQDSFIDISLQLKLTDNANLRIFSFGGNLVDKRRILRGITITADNKTLLRQDIPLEIDDRVSTTQADFTHAFKSSALNIDTTVGLDLTVGDRLQAQTVHNMPSIDTSSSNPFVGDDAWMATPRAGAGGGPNTSRSISRPKSLSYYFQENVSFFKNRLILIGGLRWFRPGGTSFNQVTNVVTNNPSTPFPTHKYGVVFRPVPSLSFYWTDTTSAFPQVGNTDRYAGNDGLGSPLSIQQGMMKEYGMKLEHSFSERISAYGSIAHYDMALTNVRTFGVLKEGIPPGSTGIVESAKDMAQGWEFEYGTSLKTASGKLDFLGTYCKGESQTAADATMMAHDFVPQKTSWMFRHQWTTGPMNGLMFGAAYLHQANKRQANFWVETPDTYNVFSRYAWGKHWSLQLNLNNVTNQYYIVAIAANGLAQTDPGLKTMLQARYRW